MAPSATITLENYAPVASKVTEQLGVDHIDVERDGRGIRERLVAEALQKHVEAVDHDTCAAGDEDAFFVADLGEVYRQHLRWKRNLKRVKPHYGMLAASTLSNVNESNSDTPSRQMQSRPVCHAPLGRARDRL